MEQSPQVENIFFLAPRLTVTSSFFASIICLFCCVEAKAWTHYHSASYDRAHVETAVARPLVALDSQRLARLAGAFQAGFNPVYAVSREGAAADDVEIVGIRGAGVWRARPEGRVIALQKLGVAVDLVDKRVRDAEASVMGARAIAAWEDSDTQELVAVISANNAIYSVSRFPNRALAIVRVGSVDE